MGLILSESVEKQAISDYLSGLTLQEAGAKNNISSSTVCNILRRHHLPRRPVKKLNAGQEKAVLELYADRKNTVSYIARQYQVSPTVILRILKANNIKPYIKKVKNFFNENVFKELDREEVCWLLGWIWSDGNMSKSSNIFNIVVARNDLPVFDKFKEVLGAESYTLYDDKTRGCVAFHMASATAYKDLLELGCMPAKTPIIRYPNANFNLSQTGGFLRGLFEGDGSFNLKDASSQAAYLGLASGSFKFMEDLQREVYQHFQVQGKLVSSKASQKLIYNRLSNFSESYKWFTSTKWAYKLLCYMYNNGRIEFYLPRKYQNFLKIKNAFESHSETVKELLRNNLTGELFYLYMMNDFNTLFKNQFSRKNMDTFRKGGRHCLPKEWQIIREPERSQILQQLGSFRDILVADKIPTQNALV